MPLRTPIRAAALLVAALLTFALAALIVTPLPLCRATAQRVGTHTTPLAQTLVRVEIDPACVRPRYAVVRYRTAQGGVLPPIGYLILRPGYPRQDRYWLRPGGRVELKRDGGSWVTIWRSGT
ncbi:hypothetical protein [Deinococcus sp. NW-56]|uniref:hypothetical protein n=1 Tax=Deinococcus sp. NW-56 TaxID=2080419 RepID=UPI000CF540AE|nr:hypothetical protein [Deinococcus sp. NW-56]